MMYKETEVWRPTRSVTAPSAYRPIAIPSQKIDDADAAVVASACRVRTRNNTIQSVNEAVYGQSAVASICIQLTYPQCLGTRGSMRRRAISYGFGVHLESWPCHHWYPQSWFWCQYRHGKPTSVIKAPRPVRMPAADIYSQLGDIRKV